MTKTLLGIDVSTLSEGAEVTLNVEEVNGQKLVTGIEAN